MPEDQPAGQPTTSRAARGLIVVLYHADRSPLRSSVRDHLYSFGRYADRECVYVNLAVRSLPDWLASVRIDAVIFHTLLLAQRWHPPTFRKLTERLQRIRQIACTKIAIPQDDYIHTDALAAFIGDLGVDHVLTCAPETEWRTIYGTLVDGPVSFRRVLPGYLEPTTMERIERLANGGVERSIDIGYRAWRPDFSLGRHALLKARVGEVVAERSSQFGLRTDISLRDEDTIFGDDWYRFMLRCRWMIGVEGGASVLDADGSIMRRTSAYVREHPSATYDEVERACFPGQDGSVRLVAISPRHLEACATRTAQILVEGSYSGALEPDRHYLPLAADFSNLDDVLARANDEELRTQIASRAYEDIVESGRFEYRAFVTTTVDLIDATMSDLPRPSRALVRWSALLDRVSWRWVWLRWRVRRAARAILGRIGLLDRVMELRERRNAGPG